MKNRLHYARKLHFKDFLLSLLYNVIKVANVLDAFMYA